MTVHEEEMVIAKMKIQADRLETRVKKLEKEEAVIQDKIKLLVRNQKKEEAYFLLRKLKMTKDHCKSARNKIQFIEGQISGIENAMDDAKFAQTLGESNRAIEKLNKEIDLEEIRIAKELQAEGKLRREEIDELLNDEAENDEIRDELNQIEAGMIEEEFDKVKIEPTGGKTKAEQKKRDEVEAKEAIERELLYN